MVKSPPRYFLRVLPQQPPSLFHSWCDPYGNGDGSLVESSLRVETSFKGSATRISSFATKLNPLCQTNNTHTYRTLWLHILAPYSSTSLAQWYIQKKVLYPLCPYVRYVATYVWNILVGVGEMWTTEGKQKNNKRCKVSKGFWVSFTLYGV